jgi:hypothetical protein
VAAKKESADIATKTTRNIFFILTSPIESQKRPCSPLRPSAIPNP